MHGLEHMQHFRWFWSDAVVFRLFKVFSSSLQHISRTTGQTFAINWSKIQLSRVLMLYYPYKMMFSVYKLVTKITWDMWWLYLEINHSLVAEIICTIYSFIHASTQNNIWITVFNSVLFSTEVHNPLHAHLLALSHVYIICIYICNM